ncbi:DNA translocase FtsK [Candidatus Kaiserbacteria bacterium]|nr:DNA translocase FtsK [Candidatus Kaiserbacteria bacterium]
MAAWYHGAMKAGRGEKKSAKRKYRTREETLAENIPEQRGAVSSGALRSVAAIFFITIATFLFIAEFGIGGPAGDLVYGGLKWLIGPVGYPLLPLSFVLLAIIIFRSFERHFGWIQVLSMIIFLLSALGIINVALPGAAGVLGGASDPLISAMRTPATVIFLFAFIVASLVIAFDLHLGAIAARIRDLFSKNEEEDDEESDSALQMASETTPHIIAPLAQDEASEDTSEKKSMTEAVISTFSNKKNDSDGFAIIAATGSTYTPPPLSILAKNKGKPEVGDVKANMNIIKRTLQNFGIQVEMDEATIGPTVTRYAMKPAEGVRLSKILALQSNLELALAVTPVRIEAPIPGKSLVGIEVPNISRTTLGLAPLVSDELFTDSPKPLLLTLGRSITGQPHYMDLAKMPHLLVAGTTGAGKSVTIHSFIVSLLYRCGPERLRFIMVDPKRVELTLYNSIPHLLTPVITDAKKAIQALKWLGKEMDRRYDVLQEKKVRDISSYHENILAPALEQAEDGVIEESELPEAMPYIVLIMDELADIMQAYPRELEGGIVRLAQMSRAVGIHLILSTQRPSVKIITGLIKANIPSRVALKVISQIDSRTILDTGGAEKLLGAGDMLYQTADMAEPTRIQAPYLSEGEVKQVVKYLARMSVGTLHDEIDFSDKSSATGGGMDPIFSSMVGADEDGESDELYPQAKQTVIEAGKASTSYLQRKLGVGYARAAKLIDLLEERGVIGPADGAKPRTIIGAGNADELASGGDTDALEDTL